MKKLTRSTGSMMIALMLMKGPVLAEPIANQIQNQQSNLKDFIELMNPEIEPLVDLE